MNLRKFKTNSIIFRVLWVSDKLDLSKGHAGYITKVLELIWNTESDVFIVRCTVI